MGLIDEINRGSKISCHCPFKLPLFLLSYKNAFVLQREEADIWQETAEP
jgi:hypothetical protein